MNRLSLACFAAALVIIVAWIYVGTHDDVAARLNVLAPPAAASVPHATAADSPSAPSNAQAVATPCTADRVLWSGVVDFTQPGKPGAPDVRTFALDAPPNTFALVHVEASVPTAAGTAPGTPLVWGGALPVLAAGGPALAYGVYFKPDGPAPNAATEMPGQWMLAVQRNDPAMTFVAPVRVTEPVAVACK